MPKPLPRPAARSLLRAWRWAMRQLPDAANSRSRLAPLWDSSGAVGAVLLAVMQQERDQHHAAVFAALETVMAARLPPAEAAPRLCLMVNVQAGLTVPQPAQHWLPVLRMTAQRHVAGPAAALLCLNDMLDDARSPIQTAPAVSSKLLQDGQTQQMDTVGNRPATPVINTPHTVPEVHNVERERHRPGRRTC